MARRKKSVQARVANLKKAVDAKKAKMEARKRVAGRMTSLLLQLIVFNNISDTESNNETMDEPGTARRTLRRRLHVKTAISSPQTKRPVSESVRKRREEGRQKALAKKKEGVARQKAGLKNYHENLSNKKNKS